MDLALLIPIAAIAFIALAIYFVTHKATEQKVIAEVKARFEQLRQHLSPQVKVLESTVEPMLQGSIDTLHQKMDELHQKADAIVAKVGGVITTGEHSQAMQDLEARLQEGKQLFQSLANALHEAEMMRASLATTAKADPAAAPAATKQG